MATEVTVTRVRPCDVCQMDQKMASPGVVINVAPAEYDAKTVMGPWANLCELHYRKLRAFPDLGTGKGQRLVVEAPK